MIRQTIFVVSAALCATLTGYGISQAAVPLPQPPIKQAAQSKEEGVLGVLNLNAKQRAEYDKLARWFKDETAKMKQLGGGAMRRGMEINAEWKEGLQKIFTRDQYRKYVRANGHLVESDGTYLATKYGKAREEQILSKLNLNVTQKKAIDDLYAQIAVELKRFNQLWEGTDGYAIEAQGYKINEMQRSGMQRILTPTQYVSYLKQWSGPANPSAIPAPNAFSPGKPISSTKINP